MRIRRVFCAQNECCPFKKSQNIPNMTSCISHSDTPCCTILSIQATGGRSVAYADASLVIEEGQARDRNRSTPIPSPIVQIYSGEQRPCGNPVLFFHDVSNSEISLHRLSRCINLVQLSNLWQVPELQGTWRAEDGSHGTFEGLKA